MHGWVLTTAHLQEFVVVRLFHALLGLDVNDAQPTKLDKGSNPSVNGGNRDVHVCRDFSPRWTLDALVGILPFQEEPEANGSAQPEEEASKEAT